MTLVLDFFFYNVVVNGRKIMRQEMETEIGIFATFNNEEVDRVLEMQIKDLPLVP